LTTTTSAPDPRRVVRIVNWLRREYGIDVAESTVFSLIGDQTGPDPIVVAGRALVTGLPASRMVDRADLAAVALDTGFDPTPTSGEP
jgi:hypothetical protein